MTMRQSWWWVLSKFGLVGVSNTVIDFLIYLSLTRLSAFWAEQYLLANAIAWFGANLYSFVVNRSWTFKANLTKEAIDRQYKRFVMVSLMGLLIVELILWIGVSQFGWHDLLVKGVAIVVAAVVTFSLHHRWTFGISSK